MPATTATNRYHALDSLRATMMLLGIVLHGALPYMASTGIVWPFKDPQTSRFFDLLVILIHLFRMPVFFVIAGFFAAFLYHERGELYFLRNRASRILAPFLVFWPWLFLATMGAFWDAQGVTGQRTESSFITFLWRYLQSNTWIHLWFLYDLLFFYAAAVVLMRIPGASSVCSGIDRIVRRVVASRFRALWLALPLVFTLIPMRTGMLDTRMSWTPLAPYYVFFIFGWFLFRVRDLVQTFTRGVWIHLALGLLAFPVVLRMVVRLRTGEFESLARMHLAAAIASGAAMALLVCGIIGLFLRYLDSYNRVTRYLTDASYWIYLVHLPLTVLLPSLLIRFDAPLLAKFLIVETVTVAVTALSYHYLVRATFIGQMLNGRRYTRSLPSRTPVPVSSPVP
jgi:peptidoglycan/LPS O-acetylase OafA/YrhL